MDTQQQGSWWAAPQRRDGLLHGLASVPASQYVKVLVPLMAVFFLAFFLEFRAEVGAERAQLLTQESSIVQGVVRRVERGMEIATSDLRFVSELVAKAIEQEGPERIAMLEQSALSFVRHRSGYDQIRFIGASGREIVRVEHGSGGPQITARGELQDKSARGYFADTMAIETGQVFISAMDPNMEHGVVEVPYKPVVRLATPIDDAAGRRRGVVVLNVHGSHFVGNFGSDDDANGIRRMIVDSDGYWVHRKSEAPGAEFEYGTNFERRFRDVWPRLLAISQGWVESADAYFFVDTVVSPASEPSPGREAARLPDLKIISLVPRQLLDKLAVEVATPLLVFATPLFFVLAAIGSLMASARERRRLAEEELRSLEALKTAMMTAALDAIVVMDETGTTLEFNPSAQEIFGYSLEEARGKLVADLIIPPDFRERHRLGLERYLETGVGTIAGKHVPEMRGLRKNGEEFPVELTVCPVEVRGRQFFYGFLRDLSASEDGEADLVARAG